MTAPINGNVRPKILMDLGLRRVGGVGEGCSAAFSAITPDRGWKVNWICPSWKGAPVGSSRRWPGGNFSPAMKLPFDEPRSSRKILSCSKQDRIFLEDLGSS